MVRQKGKLTGGEESTEQEQTEATQAGFAPPALPDPPQFKEPEKVRFTTVNQAKLDEILVALLHGHTSNYTGHAVVTHVKHLFDLETHDQARLKLQEIQQRRAARGK